MRMIDADALKEDYRMADDCKDCKTNVRDCEYDYVYRKMDFCEWLDDAPTVDAVPVVHGRWNCSDDAYESAVCSACGWDTTEPWAYIKEWFKFCPNCGASMDGKDGDNG